MQDFSLTGPISWASRAAQVEATVNTVQEGCTVPLQRLLWKREQKQEAQDIPTWNDKSNKDPSPLAYDIEELMQGVEKDAPEREVRKGDVVTCRPEQMNAHSQCTSLR